MLSDLIFRLSQVFEYKTNNTDTRKKTLAFINAAGREVWHSSDLPGSMMEQLFVMDRTLNQVSLPWYVDEIRAMRRRGTGMKVQLQDLRPRYHATPWKQPYHIFRVKGKSPLIVPLSAASQLTVTLGEAEDEALTVTIMGQTSTSARARQQLTFLPGATTHTTTLQFTTEAPFGVTDIVKDRRTNTDITITDALGNTVALLPAPSLRASNTIVSLTDDMSPAAQLDDTIEVLFKTPYPEMYYDEDTFAGSQQLEDAVYWFARSHYSSSMTDEGSSARAILEKQNAMSILQAVVENMESNVERTMEVAPNRFASAWQRSMFGNIPAGGSDYYR